MSANAPDGGLCGVVDCNDGSAVAYTGAVEICDGLDNDCDGAVDENNICGCTDSDDDGYAVEAAIPAVPVSPMLARAWE